MRLCPGPPVALDGATSWPSFWDSNNITALQYGTVCYMGNYYRDGGFFSSWEESNPETAVLSLPNDLSLIDPAWGVCSVTEYGALDPPRALVKPTAPIGLAPASILVPSPTPTDQHGPQETLAKPVPTIDNPPVQTQLGNQPPTPDSLNSPNEPADPAGANSPPNKSPQATNGNQNASPDLPASAVDSKGSADPKMNPPNNNQDASTKPSDPDTNPSTQLNVNQGDLEPLSGPVRYDYGLAVLPSLVSVLSVGGYTFTALPTNGFSIADTSIQPEGPVITTQGTRISLGSSVLVVGSSTLLLPTWNANGVLTAAGVEFTLLVHGKIRLNGKTLSINEPPITVSGTTISLASSGIAIAGQIFAFPTLAAEAVTPDRILTIAGLQITRLGNSKAIVSGVTLAVNGPAQAVSGTSLSLASNGLIIDGHTYAFPTPPPGALPRPDGVLTIADQTVTRFGSSSAIIDGMLFSVNGLAKTVSGTAVSLASTGLMVDGQEYPFPAHALVTASDAVVIDGTTLHAGGPAITISGTTLNLVSGPAGLYLTGTGAAPSAFSVPVTPRESLTMDAAGRLVEGGGGGCSEGGFKGGGLGSLIMLGFGVPGAASASSTTGATVSAAVGDAIPVIDFEGNGSRDFDSHILTALVLTINIGFTVFF